ncbi:MAG: type II toxin-antitoxin system VapC family toxin [Gordonibacter sp.]|uniref:type II toxin-antitoxin system VapC family toxin n=1 Tax=Gordonibacter sp. TaxID=1968902 RepID=UPI002FC8FDCB
MYFLDSNICIDFLRGRMPYGYRFLKNNDPRLFKIPAIVEAELRVGVAKSSDKERNRHALDTFLLPFDIVPFCSRCAREYASIRTDLDQRGERLGHNDLFIAATVRAYGGVLVTNNVKEFKHIPKLELESWAEIDL